MYNLSNMLAISCTGASEDGTPGYCVIQYKVFDIPPALGEIVLRLFSTEED